MNSEREELEHSAELLNRTAKVDKLQIKFNFGIALSGAGLIGYGLHTAASGDLNNGATEMLMGGAILAFSAKNCFEEIEMYSESSTEAKRLDEELRDTR